jgi:DNA-binding beta-propeller fold protein YncE
MERTMMRRAALTAILLSVASLAQAETTEVWRLGGFVGPESVGRDPATGKFYVSNFGTEPMSKDGDGFISTITADGKIDKLDWVTGLDAPKGIDFVGGKLYVADIDQLVEIDTASGQVSNRYKAEGAQFLNDVAAAPDGKVYISDTFGSAVYVLDGGTISLLAQDPLLMGANGLLVEGNTLLVADLGDISGGFENIKPGPVVKIDLASKAITPYGAEGPVGVLDGVEADGKGGLLLTDNPAGTVLALQSGGTATVIATVGARAADLEVDPTDGLILVPVTPANEVVALRQN